MTLGNVNIMLIIAVVLSVIIILGGIFLLGLCFYEHRCYGNDTFYKGVMGVTVIIMGVCALSAVTSSRQDTQKIMQAEEMIAAGATVYLDGRAVDAETINLSDYVITIENDNVFLIKKQ